MQPSSLSAGEGLQTCCEQHLTLLRKHVLLKRSVITLAKRLLTLNELYTKKTRSFVRFTHSAIGTATESHHGHETLKETHMNL